MKTWTFHNSHLFLNETTKILNFAKTLFRMVECLGSSWNFAKAIKKSQTLSDRLVSITIYCLVNTQITIPFVGTYFFQAYVSTMIFCLEYENRVTQIGVTRRLRNRMFDYIPNSVRSEADKRNKRDTKHIPPTWTTTASYALTMEVYVVHTRSQ